MRHSIFYNLINRIKFRRIVNADESTNVVDGMVKARALYKKLSITVHPDRNPNHKEEAEELMKKIVANKYNYAALVELEKESNVILNN